MVVEWRDLLTLNLQANSRQLEKNTTLEISRAARSATNADHVADSPEHFTSKQSVNPSSKTFPTYVYRLHIPQSVTHARTSVTILAVSSIARLLAMQTNGEDGAEKSCYDRSSAHCSVVDILYTSIYFSHRPSMSDLRPMYLSASLPTAHVPPLGSISPRKSRPRP